MADCNDLNQQLNELEAKLKELDDLEAAARAILETEDLPAAGPTRRVMRTYTGQEIGLSREAWVKQSEQDMVEMGSQRIRDLVEMGFRNNEGPRGDTGRMVNYGLNFPDYSKVAPSKENIAALLEIAGLKRSNTPKGVQLKRKFTSTVAGNALVRLMRETGATAEATFSALAARTKGIDKLPETVVQVAKARWDSVSNYALKIEQAADAMSVGALTDELKVELGYAAQWAHVFEQMDAAVRRRVGQAMRGLQFDFNEYGLELFGDDPNIARLTIQDINGETLVGQVMEHIERGDVLKLKQLAAAVRTNNLTRTSINEGPFWAQLHLLNTFRRNNMLTSPGSWLARNPVSGAGVSFKYGMEDLVAGCLRAGMQGGMEAAFHANRATLDAAQMAWKNAATYLGTGKARMGLESALEISKDMVEKEKQLINDALTNGLALLGSWRYWATSGGAVPLVGPAVTLMNVFNAAVAKTLGGLGERFLGWDGGYLPAFRLLNAGDEAVRTMAFAWKVNHEAYLRAWDEAKTIVDPATGRQMGSDWVARRAEQMAEEAMFDGMMSQEDLVKLRRERGIPPGDELPDDTLRLLAFNELKGVPRADTELGQIGLTRAADVTFTNTIKDPIIQGLGLTRQNALVAWQLPFFKTPLNSLLWSIDRTIVPSVLKAARKTMEGASTEELAQARAQAIVSLMFLTVGSAAIANGVFVGGGPSDPEEYKRWRRQNIPYSFQLGGKVLPAARFRMGGIDPIDILGLYADLMQLVVEEGISEGDFTQATTGLATALARMLNNKASLLNTTTVLNAMTQPDRTDMADILASSMGGLMPLSGILGRVAAGTREPLQATDKRRFLDANEKKALGMDPVYAEHVAPVLEFFQKVGERAARGIPGVNQVLKVPESQDWLGSKIERPFGIPAEAVVPFMPVIQPKDDLYQWLIDAGVTTKPRPKGIVGPDDGLSVGMTMTNAEEGFYRVQMRTLTGQRSAQEVLGKTPKVPIDRFVQGRTMTEALRALKRDQNYRSLVDIDPGGPDKRVNKKGLNERKKTLGYQPIEDIIRYYDMLALVELVSSQDPAAQSFRKRYEAMVRYQGDELRKREEAINALGVTRQ